MEAKRLPCLSPQVWLLTSCGATVGADIMSRVTWVTPGKGHRLQFSDVSVEAAAGVGINFCNLKIAITDPKGICIAFANF